MSEWPMVYSGVSLKWANSFFEPSGLHCSLFPRAKEAYDLSSPGNAVQVENRDEATEKFGSFANPPTYKVWLIARRGSLGHARLC